MGILDKLCKDCRWHEKWVRDDEGGDPDMCVRPRMDVVGNVVTYPPNTCKFQRMSDFTALRYWPDEVDLCGQAGNKWEAKPIP